MSIRRRAARAGGEGRHRRQVVALDDHLVALTPTPVVALDRAVAVAEVDGPAGPG